jgi:predicted nucleic acid-binding protein
MFEVANGLVTANRRGRMAAAHLTAAHGLLARLPIDVDDISLDRALGDVVRLASAYGLSAYDAAYLELAERLGLPLATQDTALQAAAVAAGTPLVEPAGPSN